jgi:3-deoxy-D-manno-octulosonate 8-phosphate phosphatase (KDO 8-P phosphatase)
MKKIKLLILDVDGVLTNGKKYYDNTGKVHLKTFCDKDWTVIKRFKTLGIGVICITGDPFNKFIEEKRNIKVYLNRKDKSHVDKREFLSEICKNYNVNSEEICFVGDDIFDVGLMKDLKYSFCPSDAPQVVKDNSESLVSKGGDNVLVELYEKLESMSLIEKKDYEEIIQPLYEEDIKDMF